MLTTRDRPEFLALAMAYLACQRNVLLEVVVIDDGALFPASLDVVGTGRRLITLPPGTPLGQKLNIGIAATTSPVIVKWDDDDWYGPNYCSTMTTALGAYDLGFVQPFRFLDLRTWRVVAADTGLCSGATLVFRRTLAERVPFRPVAAEVDSGFMDDALRSGAVIGPMDVPGEFLQVRHTGDHVWRTLPDGRSLADMLATTPGEDPALYLPKWVQAGLRAIPASPELNGADVPAELDEVAEHDISSFMHNGSDPELVTLRIDRLRRGVQRDRSRLPSLDVAWLRHWSSVLYRCGWPVEGNLLADVSFGRADPQRHRWLAERLQATATVLAVEGDVRAWLRWSVDIEQLDVRIKSPFSADRALRMKGLRHVSDLEDVVGIRVWVRPPPGGSIGKAVCATVESVRLNAPSGRWIVEEPEFHDPLRQVLVVRGRYWGARTELQVRPAGHQLGHLGGPQMQSQAYGYPGGYKFDPAGLHLPNLGSDSKRDDLVDRTFVLRQAAREAFHHLLVREMMGIDLPRSGLTVEAVKDKLRVPGWSQANDLCRALIAES